MPLCCCVPGCKSNFYKVGPSVTVFLFPKEKDMKEQWTRNIRRTNFVPTKASAICIKHFTPDAIIEEDTFQCPDDPYESVPRKKLKLRDGACPTIFENMPPEPVITTPRGRRDPNERVQRAVEREEERYKEWCVNDNIRSLSEFRKKIAERNVDPFIVLDKGDYLLFSKIVDSTFSTTPLIVVSFKVSTSLQVQVFHEDISLPQQQFEWCLGLGSFCDKWSKFDCLLSHLAAYTRENVTCKKK